MLQRFFASTLAALCVLGFAVAAQASTLTYDQVVQADAPTYYWNFSEAGGNALNNGTAAGGVLAPGASAARVASGVTNGGGLSLGNAISFDGTGNQIWSANADGTVGTKLGDSTNYTSYAIEFWVKMTGAGAQYISIGGHVTSPTQDDGNDPSVIYGFNSGKIELYTVSSPNGRTGNDFSYAADSQWHHVVLGFYCNGGSVSGSDTQTLVVDGNYAGKQTSAGIQPYFNGNPMPTYFKAVDAYYAIGGTNNGGAPVAAGSMLADYAVYNLSGLDSTAFDAKMQSLAGHYSADGTVVPEPGTLALLAGGLLGLIAYAWRKRK
jgi:hypothetical protein